MLWLNMGHLFTDLNQGALPLMLPLLQKNLGLSYTATGAIVLASQISSSIVQPLFGYYSDRRSMLWIMPLGIFVTGVGVGLAGIAPNYLFLLLAVLVSGLGAASFHPEASKVAFLVGGPRRASAMSIFYVGGNLGFGLGPLLATLLMGWFGLPGMLWVIVPSALMALGLRTSFARIVRVTGEGLKHHSRVAGQEIWRTLFSRPVMLLVLVVSIRSWVQMGVVNFIPLWYVNYLGGSQPFISSVVTAFLIGGAAGTIVGGPASDSLGRKPVIALSLALMMPLLYLLIHATGAWMMVVSSIAGFVLVSTYSVTVVFGQELMPKLLGIASGLMMGFAIGTGGIGATILGRVADVWGMPAALWCIVLLPILGFILSLFLPRDAAAVVGADSEAENPGYARQRAQAQGEGCGK